jgi:hypothetical protein
LAEIVQTVPLLTPEAVKILGVGEATTLQQIWTSAFEQWSQMMPQVSNGKLVAGE